MNRLIRNVLFVFSMVLFCASASGFFFRKSSSNAKPISYEDEIKPLLSQYCYDCHGEDVQKADLTLEKYTTEAMVLKHRDTWEKVLLNVRSGEMPPSRKPQPTMEEREKLIRWIENTVLSADCSNPDPGRVTIRRLNRNEYNNTIRDLVGVKFQPADDFPADDTGYGFDNIGDVLSLPPVLFERYMRAAEKIMDTAIVTDPGAPGPTLRITASRMRATGPGSSVRSGGFKLTQEGELFAVHDISLDGDYLLRVRAWGDQCGDEPPKLEVKVNDDQVAVFDVTAVEKNQESYEHRLHLTAGEKRISLGFINNYRDENFPKEGCDRNLTVVWLEIVGPAVPTELTETHTRIFDKPVSEVADKDAYAREIIGCFAKRAFRRPLRDGELDRLMRFYEIAKEDGEKFESCVKLALQAVLVSPHFLFRGEVQPDPDNPNVTHQIDEFALASRLSYFLWSSMPDDELFALAEKKKLRRNLHSQMKRMLRDPKSKAFVENFVGQWLQIRNLDFVHPDASEFPEFDQELRRAMRKETELLFEYVMREDRPVLELLNANYSFLNQRLAQHYGVPGIEGDQFQKVSLKGTHRSGVLTHASVLTLTSNPDRTSLVKRGKYVLENILGTPPPPPPPGTPELETSKEKAGGTLRERVEQHREDPNCASCHARMDPIGFALENFDAIGAWREKEGDVLIDASGVLVSGESFNGADELIQILVQTRREEFARCLTEKMLTYALGRGLEFYDKCAVDEITGKLRRSNYRFSTLIREIIESTPFQMRRGDSIELEP